MAKIFGSEKELETAKSLTRQGARLFKGMDSQEGSTPSENSKIFLVKAIKGDNQEYPLIEPIGEPIELTPQEVELLKSDIRKVDCMCFLYQVERDKLRENLLKKLEGLK